MTDDEYNEAKKLIAELGSMNKAAKQLGKPYATFRRQYLKRKQAESAPQPQPEPEPESEPNLTPGINWDEVLGTSREIERRKQEEREGYNPYLFRFHK